METLRREPFRLLFPLGIFLAWAAVVPWVLFGTGYLRTWPGTFHALTMTEGFIVAIAVGFLGTMIPRRTGSAPLSAAELALAVGGLVVVPIALFAGSVVAAQLAYLVVLATMATFAIRRMRRAQRAVPPAFVFLPAGALAGATGAALLLFATRYPAARIVAAGRPLVEEGLLVALVLALAPMLTPIICHGRPPGDAPTPAARRLQLGLAAAFIATFFVQALVSERAGLVWRGLVVGVALLAAGALETPSAPGLHRRLYRLALAFVPLGPLAAAAQPAYRIPFMHLTFVGGLSLLVFAVSFHVVFAHTGREPLLRRWPLPVTIVGALTLAATVVRALAERVPQHYFAALACASSLWLAGALTWGLFLLTLIARRPRTAAH